MLISTVHLIPTLEKKFPCYIVMTQNKNDIKDKIYVQHYGTQRFPTFFDDAIITQTENIYEACWFCNKEDAMAIARTCTFRCNCGCIDKVGKLIKMLGWSDRSEDGYTYGLIKSETHNDKQHGFEVRYDYVEEPTEYPVEYKNLLVNGILPC